MTADFVARKCDEWLVNKSLDSPTDIQNYEFNKATKLLNRYLQIHFLDFVETDRIRWFSNNICEVRKLFDSWYISNGYLHGNRETALFYFKQYDYYMDNNGNKYEIDFF